MQRWRRVCIPTSPPQDQRLVRNADNGYQRVRYFEKALNELKPEKNTCVSFVREEGEKGSLAKDLRQEDPERVARVTAKIHYGKVVVGEI